MRFFVSMTSADVKRYTRLVQKIIAVRRHFDLLRWLQGDVQHYLPHEVMIAAWGDFSSGHIFYDIVSALPGVRTEGTDPETLAPLLKKLFCRWAELDKAPYVFATEELGLLTEGIGLQCALGSALRGMNSSLVHGISDARGRHDCLYVIFSARSALDDMACSAIEVLLPYLDTALRQVVHLPRQTQLKPHVSLPVPPKVVQGNMLSDREVEIMKWVRQGKTNQEVGLILDISAFTVKNHLKRIFRKINVYNRTHAATKFESLTQHV